MSNPKTGSRKQSIPGDIQFGSVLPMTRNSVLYTLLFFVLLGFKKKRHEKKIL